jgi:tetratricopeptide (TPR) repeat protein
MAVFQWIAPILVLPTILVPALPKQPKEGWAGEIVLVKNSNTPFTFADRGETSEPDAPVGGTLRGIEYRVIEDKAGRLRINEHSADVWVKKEDMVLLADAVGYFTQEIEKDPRESRAHAFRGWALYRKGNTDEALKDYAEAIRLKPDVGDWRNNRAVIYTARKEYDKAIDDLDEALRMNPNSGLALRNRAVAYSQKKDYAKAIADFQRAIERLPGSAITFNGLAWLLATCPDAAHRDGKSAVQHATKACELSRWKNASFLDTLAAAYAETGEFEEAVKWQEKAIEAGDFPKSEVAAIRKRLQMYKDKKAFHAEDK